MKIEPEFLKCSCTENSCPVYKKCCFLPTEINPDTSGGVSILFIGQGGGSDERRRGRPFIGRAGVRLRQQVLYVRRRLERHIGVAFSNTIRDNPDGNRIPTQQEYDFCLKHLYKDIAELRKRGLKMIIPLGNASKSVFLPKSGAMLLCHGKISKFLNATFGQINLMPTYHPSYIIRNAPRFDECNLSEYDAIVIRDILKACRYDKGVPEPVFDQDEIDISDVL